MQSVFLSANLVAAAGWVLLLAACLIPRLRATAFVVSGLAVPALLSVAYLGLFAMVLTTPQPQPMDMSSLDGVRALLGTREGAVTGWIHYLAFDLFIGAWIVRDAVERGLRAWWLPPILVATFLAGPIGLLLYLAIRMFRRGDLAAREPQATSGAL